MKNYIKGVITGLLIGAILSALPAVAENIDLLFNQVRINVSGADRMQWGEDIELDDGEAVPSSILYKGTTYLPMRKLGELNGQKIYWNGDSKTVSMTGEQKDVKAVAEKPDKNGNVWTYYKFKASVYNSYDKEYCDISYLGVKDKIRGFERIYQIGSDDIGITDDAIYFVKLLNSDICGTVDSYPYKYGPYGYITKLSFNNNENTQDGENLTRFSMLHRAYIDDEYIYYVNYEAGNATNWSVLTIYNYKTNETVKHHIWRSSYIDDFEILENSDERISFIFKWKTPQDTYNKSINFNKNSTNPANWEMSGDDTVFWE